MPYDVRGACAIFSSKNGMGRKGVSQRKQLFYKRLSGADPIGIGIRRIGIDFEKIC